MPTKSVRRYALYSRPRLTKKWIRESEYAYPKPLAIRLWSGRILDLLLSGHPNEWRIRPAEITK